MPQYRMWWLVLVLVLFAAACDRQAVPAPGDAATQAAARAEPAPAPVVLEDVIERDPRYIVGISYSPVAKRYPGLAALLKAYADAARAELDTALQGLGDARPEGPYDLALAFSEVVATADIVAIAANGSSYTGGAHGNPLVARFVWLPARGERLAADALLADPQGWATVSSYVREQLYQRADQMGSTRTLIDQGTAPAASNFDQFEPVLDADGKIIALRFVFPPYQVGPYSAGVQVVEVPSAVLLPLVASAYRDLFR